MKTTVRNIRDGSYDAANPDHVYIGRANQRYGLPESKWANPHPLVRESEREAVIEFYKDHLLSSGLIDSVLELRGKTLYCWCTPKRCHGHALSFMADLLAEADRQGGLIEAEVLTRESGPSGEGPDEMRWRTFSQETTA